ncbi:hypothetical protein B0H13DRAFT_2335001 [Mycena leptocephala]|nr:hypothetical protein B0H13DRAFT_2335001 [Mycena leptocephala]
MPSNITGPAGPRGYFKPYVSLSHTSAPSDLLQCKKCEHFVWAPPPSPEPYGLVPSGPDPFPRDNSYPSPPPPASPAINPALQAPSSAFYAAAAAAAPSNDTSKRQCVNFRQCKKLATVKNCTSNMCKPWCGLKGTGCAYAAHQNSAPILSLRRAAIRMNCIPFSMPIESQRPGTAERLA